MTDNQRGAVYMMIAMLLFILNDTLMRSLRGELPPFQALAIRSFGSALLLVPFLIRGRVQVWGFPGRDGLRLGLRSVAECSSSILYISALFLIPLADATAILQILPLSVTLAAALFLKEPVGWRRMTAILIGFGGVMLILRPGSEGMQTGALLALAAAIMVTAREILTRSLSPAVPSLAVTFYTVAISAILAGLGSLTQDWQALPPEIWGRLAACSALMTVGFYFSVLTVRTGSLAVISPFRYSNLVFALVLGYLAFGELPDALTLAGAVIVVATGLYTLWREGRLAQAGRRRP